MPERSGTDNKIKNAPGMFIFQFLVVKIIIKLGMLKKCCRDFVVQHLWEEES